MSVAGRAAQLTLTSALPFWGLAVVDCPRHDFFARAGLATNENGRFRVGHRCDRVDHFRHRRAFTDDVVEIVLGADLFLKIRVLDFES